MQNARAVRRAQSTRHPHQQFDYMPPARLLTLSPILQRAAIDVFRNQILASLELPDVVHRQNVRMVERGDHLRLALEKPARIGVGYVVGENLDRHGPAELSVERPVDGAHAAPAELNLNAIGTQLRAGSHGSLTRIVYGAAFFAIHGVRGSLGGSSTRYQSFREQDSCFAT